MKSIVFASLALAAMTSTAFAADLPPPAYAPIYKAAPLPPPTWSGCYAAAGGGYGLWNEDTYIQSTITGASTQTITDGGRGWLGRFGGGCDYEFGVPGLGNFVVGGFGEYDVMGLSGTNVLQSAIVGAVGATIGAGSQNESSAWYGGARIGYLVTPLLLTYFDGGYSGTRFSQVNFQTQIGTPTNAIVAANTYQGWFIGGGTEYALSYDWLPIRGLFWRNEYRFATYQTATLPVTNSATGLATDVAQHVSPYTQTIATSLVWRFNWFGR
jgi:outer membrane immunogenic protein